MAEAADNEILMYVIQAPGSDPLKGESTAELNKDDGKLMSGFVAGRFFEVEDFSFSIKLADDEGGSGDPNEKRSFARWRGLRETRLKPTPPYRAEPGDVSITRMIDQSSPILLKYCLDTKPFETAVVVKRARLGESGKLQVVLRMEFKKVWVLGIDWKDGNSVMETCKFKFGSVSTSYAKHKPDGALDTVWPCEWISR